MTKKKNTDIEKKLENNVESKETKTKKQDKESQDTKKVSQSKKTSNKKTTKKQAPKEEKTKEKEEVIEEIKEDKKETTEDDSKKEKTPKKETKTKKETVSSKKKKTSNKKDETKKESSKKEEVIVKEVSPEEDIEEKLSQTFIERTKKFIDESNQYVEDAIELEEIERTQEFENTQIIKIREALKPIGKKKKAKRNKRNANIDEDFLDVNNRDEHLFLKLVLIIGVVALFIWLMPKIASKIDKHFVIDNTFTPYVPEEEPAKPAENNKDEENESELNKSEEKLTEDEVKELLGTIPPEVLKLPTTTNDYTMVFAKQTMDINGIECYLLDVYVEINKELTHIAGFAVSVYGEKIFRMNNEGGFEKVNF